MSRPFAVRFEEPVAREPPTERPPLTPEMIRFLKWLAREACEEAVRESETKARKEA